MHFLGGYSWVTGLQGLQKVKRVARIKLNNMQKRDEFLMDVCLGCMVTRVAEGYKGCKYFKPDPHTICIIKMTF